MKYKVRYIKNSELSGVPYVFEETELDGDDEAQARAAFEAGKTTAPGWPLLIDLSHDEGHKWESVDWAGR